MLNNTKIDTDNIKEDFEYIVETITYVKLWVILFVLIAIKIILFKTIKLCKRIYTVHNERVIRHHSTTSTQA